MDIRECIQSRKSIRKYEDEVVDAKVINEIQKDLEEYSPKFGISKVRFEILKTKNETKTANLGFLGGIGKINAPYCIIGICEDYLGMQELGFALEQEVLKLTLSGYGTCWLGTFDREALNIRCSISGKERIGVIVAFGVSQDGKFLNNNFRNIAGSTKRKDIKKIWLNSQDEVDIEIAELVEMSILAPSTNNSQPVRIVIKDCRADFFVMGNSRIDAGIFMAHFYLCANKISNDIHISVENRPFECYNRENEMQYVASIFFVRK